MNFWVFQDDSHTMVYSFLALLKKWLSPTFIATSLPGNGISIKISLYIYSTQMFNQKQCHVGVVKRKLPIAPSHTHIHGILTML